MILIKVRQPRAIYNEYDLQKIVIRYTYFLIPKNQHEKDNGN